MVQGQGEQEEHDVQGGKAVVTIKFLADKAKLKKIMQASSGDDSGDDEESGGKGSLPGMPR